MKQLINPVNGEPIECDETGWPLTMPKPEDPAEQAEVLRSLEWGSDHPNGCGMCRQDTLVRVQNGEYCANSECAYVMAFGGETNFRDLYEMKFGPGSFATMGRR
jgi:hypothetical protein